MVARSFGLIGLDDGAGGIDQDQRRTALASPAREKKAFAARGASANRLPCPFLRVRRPCATFRRDFGGRETRSCEGDKSQSEG